jgi:hypothetical protein
MPDNRKKTKPSETASEQASVDQSTSAAMPLFYQKPEPLNAAAHSGKGLRRPRDYSFAAASHAVVLHAEEFRLACAHYPIVFADDETAVPIAVLGHGKSRNLFVDATGNWDRDTYIPAYVRRYPFVNGRGANENEITLYIDTASDLVVDLADNPDAEPLFIDGKPSEHSKRALDFCAAFQAQSPITAAFVDEIKSRDMLERRNVQVDLLGGTQRQLTGLRVISEKAYNALPDDVWLEWRKRGWVSMVHWHWVSMDNFIRMSKRT